MVELIFVTSSMKLASNTALCAKAIKSMQELMHSNDFLLQRESCSFDLVLGLGLEKWAAKAGKLSSTFNISRGNSQPMIGHNRR